jgi:hypothetical protein
MSISNHIHYYATSRKVRGSIPEDVIEFVNRPNLYSHALTETSTRNIPGDKGRPTPKAGKLTAVYELTVYKMWQLPQRLTTVWGAPWPVTGIDLL